MRIILQLLQSLIVQLNWKLIKALKPMQSSGDTEVQFKVRNFGICWFLHKNPTREEKCENVVMYPLY